MTAFGWAFVLAVMCVVLGMALGWLYGLLVAYREDRAREARFAEEWVKTHRQHQHDGRYVTDDLRRPE